MISNDYDFNRLVIDGDSGLSSLEMASALAEFKLATRGKNLDVDSAEEFAIERRKEASDRLIMTWVQGEDVHNADIDFRMCIYMCELMKVC